MSLHDEAGFLVIIFCFLILTSQVADLEMMELQALRSIYSLLVDIKVDSPRPRFVASSNYGKQLQTAFERAQYPRRDFEQAPFQPFNCSEVFSKSMRFRKIPSFFYHTSSIILPPAMPMRIEHSRER